MRIRVPAPTLLSRVTPDVDKDWKGYAISNIANVDIQTDGVIINDLLLKRFNSSNLYLRDSGDTGYRDFRVDDLLASGNVNVISSGGAFQSPNADNAYALIKARDNTVGLAEIARLTGAATPTFDILAGRLTGNFNCNSKALVNRALQAGDVIVKRADTQVLGSAISYTKVKEIQTAIGGTLRIKFSLRTTNTSYAAYGQVYKNGVAYGTEQSTTSNIFVVFSEDLSFAAGDLIQLYYRSSDSAVDVEWRNFRVCASEGEEFTVLLDT